MQNIVLTLKTSDINLSDTQADYLNAVVTSTGSISNRKKTFTWYNVNLKNLLELESISIDFFKICPHSPLVNCLCRKPKTQLGEQAVSEYNIDQSTTYMVGDQKSDIEFGVGLGLKTIFIGKATFHEIIPTYSVQSILQAAKKIESSI